MTTITIDPLEDCYDINSSYEIIAYVLASDYDFEIPDPKKPKACTWHAFLTGTNQDHKHEEFREKIIQDFLE